MFTVRGDMEIIISLDSLLEMIPLSLEKKLIPNFMITKITADSRKVISGTLFVACPGDTFDGHDFIDQAVANGAGYVVCHTAHAASHYAAEAPPEGVPGGTCGAIRDTRYETILVDDSAAAAGMLAQAAAGSPAAKLTNLAVTGTNGKTTIGFLVRSVINQTGSKCGLIGTVICDACSGVEQEAVMTTPDCLAVAQMTADMVANGAEYMVIEASSHALSQNRLAGVEFKAAAFTNLTGDHFDYHKTEEAYLAAKTKLFTGLAADAVAVLNRQSPHAELIGEQTKARILWYAARTPPEGVPSGTCGAIRNTQYEEQTQFIAANPERSRRSARGGPDLSRRSFQRSRIPPPHPYLSPGNATLILRPSEAEFSAGTYASPGCAIRITSSLQKL